MNFSVYSKSTNKKQKEKQNAREKIIIVVAMCNGQIKANRAKKQRENPLIFPNGKIVKLKKNCFAFVEKILLRNFMNATPLELKCKGNL